MNLHKSPYLNDILEQPDALQNTFDGLKSASDLSFIRRQIEIGQYQRIVLTGMGSSYHVLCPLYLRLIEQGKNVHWIETSELIHYASGWIKPDTLIILVSQSGESAEVTSLMELVNQKATVIGVTNTPDSFLARNSTTVVLTQAGAEGSVSCKTYLASLAALSWLGDGMITDPAQSHFSKMFDAPRLVSQYLTHWQGYVEQLIEMMAGLNDLFLVGRGPSLSAVGTGGLIIKEAAQFHAEGMSSAAFRHGPLEMITRQAFLLAFTGPCKTASLNVELVKDVISAGGHAAIIKESSSQGVFNLPIGNEPMMPILEILPIQLLSVALAVMRGIEPGQFEHASKVTMKE
jgi:glucosamine--fructose-6-phosphate aminotransferase (isomerizing)